VKDLRLIGLDRVEGFWTPTVLDEWRASGLELKTVARLGVDRARELIAKGEVHVLDVRRPDERARGHIPGSLHVPLAELIKGEAN
ncbi:rhodanese-like domain-containing protein, partial [Escherichia coli]|nr:rhodanese-like domain-containing protein [Escherichia coli]